MHIEARLVGVVHGAQGAQGQQCASPAGRTVQRGQLVQRLEAQIVQKLPRGGEQGWPPDRFAVANDFDPAPVFELFEQL